MAVSLEKLGLIIGDVTDTTNRPFIPGQGAQEFCPNMLPGREAYVTDLVAFREYQDHREDVDLLISFIRTNYPDQTINIDKVFEASVAIHQLPIYLTLRKNNPVEEKSLPPSTLDASRAAAGIISVALKIIMDNFGQEKNVTPEEMLSYASGSNPEKRNMFLSRKSNESCPAPNRVVKNILNRIYFASDPERSQFEHADWYGLISKDEIARCIAFGASFMEFQGMFNALNTGAFTDPEGGDELITRLSMLYEQLNSLLGY